VRRGELGQPVLTRNERGAMKRISGITILLLLVLVVCQTSIRSQTQEVSSLAAKIENSVKTMEPSWKLADSYCQDRNCLLAWKYTVDEKARVLIQIYYAESAEAASKYLTRRVGTMSIGPTGKREGIGDETAYIWDRGKGAVVLKLRSVNVYISISATSEEQAKGLAQRIIGVIPGKVK
jgi:hypothetical protein